MITILIFLIQLAVALFVVFWGFVAIVSVFSWIVNLIINDKE
jgi:hypothetical protein